ncbi:MAG: hypothetical protein DRH56_07005 [Deltaproteobacteria bacterium]|nr:MAG: hypothetical protein DRH56_07005 [Deltaproteobacteria bacterium]
MRVKPLLIVAGLLAGVVPFPAHAGDPETADGRVTVSTEEIDPPSLEFIEYLGSWETQQGHWVDPADLEELMKKKKEVEDEAR